MEPRSMSDAEWIEDWNRHMLAGTRPPEINMCPRCGLGGEPVQNDAVCPLCMLKDNMIVPNIVILRQDAHKYHNSS